MGDSRVPEVEAEAKEAGCVDARDDDIFKKKIGNWRTGLRYWKMMSLVFDVEMWKPWTVRHSCIWSIVICKIRAGAEVDAKVAIGGGNDLTDVIYCY